MHAAAKKSIVPAEPLCGLLFVSSHEGKHGNAISVNRYRALLFGPLPKEGEIRFVRPNNRYHGAQEIVH